MDAFLMSLASDQDHWMFVTSSGAMTAGRVDPDHALFPYYTQDKLEDMLGRSGGWTLMRIGEGDGARVWEPFSRAARMSCAVERRVSKNDLGSHIVLEERERASGLVISVSWRASERYGFVRRVELRNEGTVPVRARVLDGMLNLLPPGLTQRFQNEFSILGDAYKQAERIAGVDMGVYHLSSVPTDLAMPMESLRATVAWQCGLDGATVLLSEAQVAAFASGESVDDEPGARGVRGAFLLADALELAPGQSRVWRVCADTGKDAAQVETLAGELRTERDLAGAIEADCARTEANLERMLFSADAFQCGAEPRRTMRHTSNTLFNLMRGGAFVSGYQIPVSDLLRTVRGFNRAAADELGALIDDAQTLPATAAWDARHPLAGASADLRRLVREYLPLTFSRRHGDPSRPWNRFSIRIRESDGTPRLAYEGNWRDIFQNWEALLYSYPEYTESVVCRFLNATTADGYNPYRLTKDGFEWEVLEPHDTWANIGYWGDHQIIYLLRLLEASRHFHPGRLQALLGERLFVYAEIPYRIRDFEAMLRNPRATIDYDHDWAARIDARVKRVGVDGKLMHAADGAIRYVCMAEKLLAPLLAKMANFVPGGGIWMNTQRPEWNDANNALVGNGISVVTLAYIHRYLNFLDTTLQAHGPADSTATFALSSELATLLQAQLAVFSARPADCTPAERLAIMRALGQSVAEFRAQVYDHGLSGATTGVPIAVIRDYIAAARAHVAHTLRANQREDALWHSYNLLRVATDGATVGNLFVMLEGQVAILSSGLLDAAQSCDLLRSLHDSPLYRPDQDSYILYPNHGRPGFLDKNKLAESDVRAVTLLRAMVDAGDHRLVKPRPGGGFQFIGDLRNADDLASALDRIADDPRWSAIAASSRADVLELFERSFNHHAFTGRSGTFFAYEGLGSIYWHMVSKLVLATQELILDAQHAAAAPALRDELVRRYRELRDGLGVMKAPAHYGAFPTDAYSHTPAHAGAQQPGMTGQVKEDILIRLAELGVRVREGRIAFSNDLFPTEELLQAPRDFHVIHATGKRETIPVADSAMAFTFCQVPVIVQRAVSGHSLSIVFADGSTQSLDGVELPPELSREIFERTGRITRIEVLTPLPQAQP